MKLVRNLLAALVIVVAAAACDSMPTAPDVTQSPMIGSGIGTGTGPG